MSTKQPIRLLILEESQNRAEELIVLLRNAGRATRAHQVKSADELSQVLIDQPWDMFLARESANGVCAEECIKLIKTLEKDVPFVLLANSRDPSVITAGMQIDALDVTLEADDEQPVLVIERELRNLEHRRARRRAMVELRETERRNQLLLDSSTAAIAYIHEGMHIYANRAYGELFGYEDLDDFVGIPIIDLISSEDQDKFKTFLKTGAETIEQGDGLSVTHIQALIKEAIAQNSLKLLFQPIIRLHGDDDEQFEVLLRLIDNDGNELLPGQFLGPAEEAGMLPKLDRWVILQSIKMLSVQRSEGRKERLFINITSKSVIDDTFLPWVSVALKAARLPSDALIFQVHENDATSHIKQARIFAQGISQLHCKTSINHFGCSLNPFNLLKHLSPDYVKLDGSFAQQIEDNKDKRKELIDMVKALQQKGVVTAISGVESPIALSTPWEAGVNFIQGYYISPPLETLDYDFASEGA